MADLPETTLLVGMGDGRDDRWFADSARVLTEYEDGTSVHIFRIESHDPQSEARRSSFQIPETLGGLVAVAMSANYLLASNEAERLFGNDIRIAGQFLVGRNMANRTFFGVEAMK